MGHAAPPTSLPATPPAPRPRPRNWSLLPEDIALSVVSLLEATDVCALGSCGRTWRRLCAADCVWARLYRRRWPEMAAPAWRDPGQGSSSCEGWKARYINHHRGMGAATSHVIKFVKSCSRNESLEAGHYWEAIGDLGSLKLGFDDVQFFLFSRKLNVILNLIGLHYSIVSLQIPPNDVLKALVSQQVAERQVSVSLFKLGRWFYDFQIPDEKESYKASLAELTMTKEEKVLAILNRGAVHEMFRVQVSPVVS